MPPVANVVLGVTGGIAAYKACELLRLFTESGYDVRVVPTESALAFVGAPWWAIVVVSITFMLAGTAVVLAHTLLPQDSPAPRHRLPIPECAAPPATAAMPDR